MYRICFVLLPKNPKAELFIIISVFCIRLQIFCQLQSLSHQSWESYRPLWRLVWVTPTRIWYADHSIDLKFNDTNALAMKYTHRCVVVYFYSDLKFVRGWNLDKTFGPQCLYSPSTDGSINGRHQFDGVSPPRTDRAISINGLPSLHPRQAGP